MEFNFYFQIILILITSVYAFKKQSNPTLVWSTENKLFKSDNELVINVKIGEFLNIICPRYDLTSSSSDSDLNLQLNSIYLVNKNEYDECKLDSTSNHRLLLKCDKPFDNLKYTLYISKYSPVPDAIEFSENNDYYLISTSDGTLNGLNNTAKGTCHTDNMKLVLRVSDSKSYHQQSTKTNQYLKRLTSSIIKSTTKRSTIGTTTKTTTTSTTAISTTSKTSNDIFILEPSDSSNDYSDLLQMLTTNNSENNNNNGRNVLNEKQVSSASSVLVSHSVKLVYSQLNLILILFLLVLLAYLFI